MAWFWRFPLFVAVLLLVGPLLALEIWYWSVQHRQSRHDLADLARKQEERVRLTRQSPALDGENEQAVAQDLAHSRKVLAALQAQLQGGVGAGQTGPNLRGVDLYFDLASLVENARTLAARARVALNPEECFGFATYAREGPGVDLVPAVLQQRVVVQSLVEALIEARPRSVLGVRRERPMTAAQRGRLPSGIPPDTSGGHAEDFFDLPPSLSVRVPGLVDSDAFRLEFTGQTAALRAFLNTLAALRLPVIVRSVEVEPLSGENDPLRPIALPSSPDLPVPLVAQNLSRFGVTVEVIQLAGIPEQPTP
jgi:hypothetical protein